MILLGIFLEIKLAFWVTAGIGIAFLGSFLVLPSWDISINMISMFAFIISLGIVVDDAIVVVEHLRIQAAWYGFMEAAIKGRGHRDDHRGLINIAFALTMVPAHGQNISQYSGSGDFGSIISLVESFILPAHLAHSDSGHSGGVLGAIHRGNRKYPMLFGFHSHRLWANFIASDASSLRRGRSGDRHFCSVDFVGLEGRMAFIFMPRVERIARW